MDADRARRARPPCRSAGAPAAPAPGAGRRAALQALLCGIAGPALGRTSTEPAHQLRPWPADKAAPKLELADLDGRTWSLPKLLGRPVLLNFWATWCEPCRAEMPSLELLATRFEGDGLVVLSVNYQEALPAIKRFLDVLPFSLPILLDRDGTRTMAWTPRVFPTTVFVDRSGRPVQSVVGEVDWTGTGGRALVEPLLARRRPA